MYTSKNKQMSQAVYFANGTYPVSVCKGSLSAPQFTALLPMMAVWWLILCINLTGPRDAPIVDKTLFLMFTVRLWGCLGKRSAFGPADWSPLGMLVASAIRLMTQTEHKGRGREKLLSLFELGHPSSPALGHQPSWFTDPQTQTELHQQPSWSSSLYMADGGSSQPPLSCTPIPIVNLLICTVFCHVKCTPTFLCTSYMGLLCLLLYPWHVIIIPMSNVHPYFSLGNLGKKEHIIHGKILILWRTLANRGCIHPFRHK